MSNRLKTILKGNFYKEDVHVTVGWILLILANIIIVPKIFMPENERFRYLGEVISEEKGVTVIDPVTHEYNDYAFYIRYRDDAGVEHGLSPKHDCDETYRIKTDRNSGKKYLYEMTTVLCMVGDIIVIVMIGFLCLVVIGVSYDDGGKVRDFLRSCRNVISDLMPEKPKPEITNRKERNDGPPQIIV